MKPYVISGELELASGIIERKDLDGFRVNLIADLERLGKRVEFVETEAIATGLNRLIRQSPIPVVTLDARYVRPELTAGQLALSRAVTDSLDDAGYDNRVQSKGLADQLDRIGATLCGAEVALADDVLFGGNMALWVVDQLEARGVIVSSFYAGLAIGEGAELLGERGIATAPVRTYSEVDDELCERDFVMVPGSGRKVIGREMNALYFDNQYGRPEWSSLPADAMPGFCVRSLERSLGLLRPGQDIRRIGRFLGYPSDGPIEKVIGMRIAQELGAGAVA